MSMHPPTPEEQAAISANNCVPLTRKITSVLDLSADRALTQDNISDGTTYKQYNPAALAATGGTATDVRSADTLTSGEAVTLGYAVGVKNASGTPKAYKASAASASTPGLAVGVATATVGAADLPLTVQSTGLSPIIPDAAWDALPAVTDVGSVVYLSTTAGKLTLTAPTGSDRVQPVGKLAVGGTGACKIELAIDAPQASSTPAAGSVTLAMMANLAANSIILNNTGSPATPIAGTVAQVKTLLAYVPADILSGTGIVWNATNVSLQLGGAAASATSILATLASKTLASPAAGSLWDGIANQASTLTVTMGAGAVTVTALKAVNLYGPTILTGTGAGALTVTDAYNVYIGAAPVAGAGTGTTTLTNSWSLGVAGRASFADGAVATPALAFQTDPTCGISHSGTATTGVIDFSINGAHGFSISATDLDFCSTGTATEALHSRGYTASAYYEARLGNSTLAWQAGILGDSTFYSGFFNHTNNRGFVFRTNGVTHTNLSCAGDLILGINQDYTHMPSTKRLSVFASKTIASDAAAVWNGISFEASTAALTGATAITTATGFNLFSVSAPTIVGNTATCVISAAATVYISGPPIAGANVTIAAAQALKIGTGSLVCQGAALATNSTDGFLYIPTCAGAPTGVPTTQTGTVPLVFDTTNHRLYLYDNGSWA